MGTLTPESVKKLLRNPTKRFRRLDGDGLFIDVRMGGASWVFTYRSKVETDKDGQSKKRPMALGEVKLNLKADEKVDLQALTLLGVGGLKLGLKDARDVARWLRVNYLDKGKDPLVERGRLLEADRDAHAQARRKKRDTLTVADLFGEWLKSEESDAWELTTREGFESHVRTWIVPNLGDIPVSEVRRAHINDLIRKSYRKKRTTATIKGKRTKVMRGGKATSNRVFETCRLGFGFAVANGHIDTNPCDGANRLYKKEKKRDRVYTDEELRGLVAAVKGRGDYEDLIHLLLRTGPRIHETQSMRLEDIDRDQREWVLPAEVTKQDRVVRVPLTRKAWEIVKARGKRYQWRGYAFRSSTVCRRKSYCQRFYNKKDKQGHMAYPTHATRSRIAKDAGLMKNVGTEQKPKWEGEPFRSHDIQHTIGHILSERLGIDPLVVNWGVLAHAPEGEMAKTYLSKNPIPIAKIRHALEKWEAYLDCILAGERWTGNVVEGEFGAEAAR